MKKELFVVRPVHGYQPGYPQARVRRRFMLVSKPVLLFNLFTVAVVFMLVACGQNDEMSDSAVKFVGVTQLAENGDADDLFSDNGPPATDELLAEEDIIGGEDLLVDDAPVAADDLLDVDEVLVPDEFEDMEESDDEDVDLYEMDIIGGVAPPDDAGMTDDDYVEEPDYDDYWMNQLGGAPPACGCAVVG